MASILSQFNEVGTVEYEAPDDTSIYLFGADVTTPGAPGAPVSNPNVPVGTIFWTADNLNWDYAPPGSATPNQGGPQTMWQTAVWANSFHSYGSAQWSAAFLPEGQNYWEDRSVTVPWVNENDSVQLTVAVSYTHLTLPTKRIV